MKVYGLQFETAWEDKETNFRRTGKLLKELCPGRDSLVVLPEMFSTGFSRNVRGMAESETGPTAEFVRKLAKAHGVYLVAPFMVEGRSGLGSNEAWFITPEGEVCLRYSKMHPFRFAGEHLDFQAGQTLGLCTWEGVETHVSICYDLRFPEMYRQAVFQGAIFHIVPANWPAARSAHWEALLRARAIENQAYVLGVNRVGSDPNVSYAGGSLLINPRGEILDRGTDQEGWIRGEIDVNMVQGYRKEFPALEDMRRDFKPPASS